MTILGELDTNNPSKETAKTKNVFAHVLEEDESFNVLNEDDEEENDSDAENKRMTLKPPRPTKAPRPSILPTTKKKKQRRRRRSSARFLRLSGRFHGQEDDDDDDDEEEPVTRKEHLGEMYKQAIRMNAENRINAGNSWSLRLIENIDKFLVDDQDQARRSSITNEPRVNFTKASCTLDASVKIYSYRVDDVHLTSYKVLANLNRSEAGANKPKAKTTDGAAAAASQEEEGSTERHSSRGPAETLESNPANLNLNKLDSAYDIDPLFHKMSKTFDEGGAKGLLLVNLGVGSNGCNIVFDSKEDAFDEKPSEMESPANNMVSMVDISSLEAQLDVAKAGATLESTPLVPQLGGLREEYIELQAEGFVDLDDKEPKSQRYAAPEEEEKEAEISIHQDALERSRMSQATKGVEWNDDDNTTYAPDDFGGDDDHADDDAGFSEFLANDDSGARYSSISFQNEPFIDDSPDVASNKTTSVLLDEICKGGRFDGNDYEFFSQATLDKLNDGNQWAGSAHWKRSERLRRRDTDKKSDPKTPGKKKTKQRKKARKERTYLDFDETPDLTEILKKPKTSKRSKVNPLQFSKSKHEKSDNLLPPDAGYTVEKLSALFMRPKAIVRGERRHSQRRKTVGFQANVEFAMDFDDGSVGGDDYDDGPGFQLATDDFVVEKLDDVRKVEKIKIGYATVAKKVDVRRLKKDLWVELSSSLDRQQPVEEEKATSTDEEGSVAASAEESHEKEHCTELSFQETVREMESSQSQSDVTLPFYFICMLHLANEQCLRLDSKGLTDFSIANDRSE